MYENISRFKQFFLDPLVTEKLFIILYFPFLYFCHLNK